MKTQLKYLECDGVQVVVSIETQKCEEHPIYYPSNMLFYVAQGQLSLKLEQEFIAIPKGSFALVKKNTIGRYFKTWEKPDQGVIIYAFAMQDDFLKTSLRELAYDKIETDCQDAVFAKVLILNKNNILQGLFDSLIRYISDNELIDQRLLALKTKEALLGILNYNPQYIPFFLNDSASAKADLVAFMNHNYVLNIPLTTLAKMSGRSIASFNRDFKKLFQDSPHKWILKKRLDKAKELLLTTDQKISDIYFPLGFEDFAHFSRVFKKHFGKSPTEMRQSSVI